MGLYKTARSQKYYQEHKEERKNYVAKYYQEHKEEQRIDAIQRQRKLKFEVFSQYCGGYPYCARCGIKDINILTIDHVGGNGNKHLKMLGIPSGTPFYYWLKRNNFPEGFQVLCWNCNHKERIKGRG